MKSAIGSVTEFHRAMGQHVGDPAAPDITVDRELRVRLLLEEVQELCDAIGVDLYNPATGGGIRLDKLKTELAYDISTGERPVPNLVETADALADIAYVTVGAAVTWGIPLAEVVDEVHASNMTKVGGDKREDGKILKPVGYRPPAVAGVLARVSQHASFDKIDQTLAKRAFADCPLDSDQGDEQ